VYDGLYVWRVTANSVTQIGRTTHSVRDFSSQEGWWYGYGDDVRSIKRSLYVNDATEGETILTVSMRQMRAHKVSDLSLTSEAKSLMQIDLTTPACSPVPWGTTTESSAMQN